MIESFVRQAKVNSNSSYVSTKREGVFYLCLGLLGERGGKGGRGEERSYRRGEGVREEGS